MPRVPTMASFISLAQPEPGREGERKAGVRGGSVIINLPGSAKGSLESLQALFPGLLHIFSMMAGEGHGPADAKEGGKG